MHFTSSSLLCELNDNFDQFGYKIIIFWQTSSMSQGPAPGPQHKLIKQVNK